MQDRVPYWGEFQSLIQLAIALNTAFAIISSYAGKLFQRDTALISSYITQAEFYAQKGDASASALILKLDELKQKIEMSVEKFERTLDGPILTSCLLVSFISLFFLFYSSYMYKERIGYAPQAYIFLQYAPFIAGMIYGFWLSRINLPSFSEQRESLFVTLHNIERKHLSNGSTESSNAVQRALAREENK